MSKGWLVVMTMQLTACVHSSASAGPGLLVNPDAASRAELLQVVSTALGGAPLQLAETAFTSESVLLIERAPQRDARGLPVDGRVLDRPERFLLSVSGTRCILSQERTGQRWILRQSQCRANPR